MKCRDEYLNVIFELFVHYCNILCVSVRVCVCLCVYACVCMRVCVYVRMHVHVRAHTCIHVVE